RKWISEYGNLDTLLARAEEIKGKAGESLRENRESAILSKSLATIGSDLPIPFEPDALKLTPPDPEKLKALLTKLEFHSPAADVEEPVEAPPIESVRLPARAAFSAAPCVPVGLSMLAHGHEV